jgi:CBS domain containing-hemolysin-like protein
MNLELIGFLAAAFFALVSFWPSKMGQIFDAGMLGAETLLKAKERRRLVPFSHESPPESLIAIH